MSESEEKRTSAFWTSLLLTAGLGVLGVVITYFTKEQLADVLNLGIYKNELFQTVLLTALTAVMTIFLYFHYGLGHNNFQNFLQFLRGSLWVIICIAISLFMELTLTNIILVINVCMIFILLFSIPVKHLSNLFPIKFNALNFKELINYCVPLLPYFAGVWGIPMIIRTQLNIYEGAKDVALFSVCYTLMEIVFMFISTITATLSPYFFAEEKNNEKPGLLYNIMLKYSVLCILLIIPFIYISRYDLILLITSDKYLSAGHYIPLLIVFPLLRVIIVVFEQVYLKESKTIYLGVVYSIAMLLAFVLSVWLIPAYSIFGAIISSLVSYGLLFIFLFIKQRHKMDFTYLNFLALFKLCVLIGIVVFALGFVPIHSFIKWLPLALIMILGLYLLPIFSEQEKNKLLSFLKIKK